MIKEYERYCMEKSCFPDCEENCAIKGEGCNDIWIER